MLHKNKPYHIEKLEDGEWIFLQSYLKEKARDQAFSELMAQADCPDRYRKTRHP